MANWGAFPGDVVTGFNQWVKDVIRERATVDGVLVDEITGAPLGDVYSFHHRQPRGMGGSKNKSVNSPSNGLLISGTGTTGTHGWIESHRDVAVEKGWIVRQGVAQPVNVPVFLFDGWWYLLPNGRKEPAYTEPPF